ncbi:MAG: dihydroorotate dehydrogenase (quinone), partial [Geminicoccaceae bacterium]
DYASGLKRVSPLADYVTINISSPNTPGLRALQAAEALRSLLERIAAERSRGRPVLLKIAPDLEPEEIEAITDLVIEYGLDGMIVSNTTVSRPDGLSSEHRGESGGLSGRPLRPLALSALRQVARRARGRIDIVGVGGISSGADVYERIRAGATAVQVYTAFVYQGPFMIRRMLRELGELMERDGMASLADAIGADLRLDPGKSGG